MRRFATLGVFAVGTTLAISGVGIMSVSATPPSPTYTVVICHATGPKAYVQLQVQIPSSEYLDGGHSTNRQDIIPPYTYGAFHYAGKNWTAQGQAIWLAGCSLSADASTGGAMTAESAPRPVTSGAPAAATGDTGASEVIGILLSTIGFLAMGLGLIAYRRREPWDQAR
jgi:hypothetical protein